MKNEQYLQLLPIERQLKSVQTSSYARLSAKEFEAFCDTYKDIFGTELTRNEKNCNVCRLKALKKVAEEFFNYQKWYSGRWGCKPEERISESEENKEKTEDKSE